MKYKKTLFNAKDMYLLSCIFSGKQQSHNNLSNHKRRVIEQNNVHLLEGMEFSETNEFPILKAYNGSVDFDFHPFANHRKLDGKGQAIHFFLHTTTNLRLHAISIFKRQPISYLSLTVYSLLTIPFLWMYRLKLTNIMYICHDLQVHTGKTAALM